MPVGRVPGVAGLGVGPEDLPRVVGGDLVLVAVGRDNADMEFPFACAVRVARRLAEQAHPRRAVPGGGLG